MSVVAPETFDPITRGALTPVLAAGIAAGALDGCYFSVVAWTSGSNPVQTLRAISSFWLGSAAFSTTGAALLGLLTHLGLAIVMAGGYAVLARLVPTISARPAIAGPAYGILLYIVMYLIVMPLRWPTTYPRFDGIRSMADVILHMAFGFVIAFMLSSRPAAPISAPMHG